MGFLAKVRLNKTTKQKTINIPREDSDKYIVGGLYDFKTKKVDGESDEEQNRNIHKYN